MVNVARTAVKYYCLFFLFQLIIQNKRANKFGFGYFVKFDVCIEFRMERAQDPFCINYVRFGFIVNWFCTCFRFILVEILCA